MERNPHRLKPAVNRRLLLLFAGLLWLTAGTVLVLHAVGWLREGLPGQAVLPAVAGGLAGLLIHHFGFLRIVDRNLGRIRSLPGRPCAFAFMPLRSYLMIAVMMAAGFALRHSPLPRPILAAVYLAIGSALCLSSVRYLRNLLRGGG